MAASFNFGAGDWELEFWLLPRAFIRNFGTIIGNSRPTWGAGSRFVMIYGEAVARARGLAVGCLAVGGFDAKTGGGVFEEAGNPVVASAALAAGVIHHVCVNKLGSLLRIWVGGGVAGSGSTTATWDFGSPGLLLGANGWDGVSGYLDAEVFDMKVRSVPVRTSAFAPPAAPVGLSRIFGPASAVTVANPAVNAVTTGGAFTASEGFSGCNYGPIPGVRLSAGSVLHSAPVSAPADRLSRGWVARDLEYGGQGRIWGTTKTKGSPSNLPAKARVVLLHQRSKLPVCEVWSDPITGAFVFEGIDTSQQFLVLAEDAAGNFRPVAASRLAPEAAP